MFTEDRQRMPQWRGLLMALGMMSAQGTWAATLAQALCDPEQPPTVDMISVEQAGPGVLSTPQLDDAVAFHPDGLHAWVSRRDGQWGDAGLPGVIHQLEWHSGGWSDVGVLDLSGLHSVSDPAVSPDGESLLFVATDDHGNRDLWLATWDGAGWVAPERLDQVVNSAGNEYRGSFDEQGQIYFASDRPGGVGQGDLYTAGWDGDALTPAQPLSSTLNRATGEWNILLAPDASLAIFEASGRPTNISEPGDLYVSWNRGGAWSVPVNLRLLNSPGSDLNATLSPDLAHLYFASTRAVDGRDSDLYRIPLRALGRYCPDIRRQLIVGNRRGRSVDVVNLDQQAGERIRTTAGPRALALNPRNHRLFVANDPTAITTAAATDDAGTADAVARLRRGAAQAATVERVPTAGRRGKQQHAPRPDHLQTDAAANHGLVSVIVLNQSADRQRQIKVCSRPADIAVERDRLWVSCDDQGVVQELNPNIDTVLNSYDVGAGARSLFKHPELPLVLVAHPEHGQLSRIDVGGGDIKTLDVAMGSDAMAWVDNTLWLVSPTANQVTVVDIEHWFVVTTLHTPAANPVALAVTPDGREVWVAQGHSALRSSALGHSASNHPAPGQSRGGETAHAPGAIAVYDVQNKLYQRTISLAAAPHDLVFDPVTQNAFVSLPDQNAVVEIDRFHDREINRLAVGEGPGDLMVRLYRDQP